MLPPEDEVDGQRAGHHRQPERDQETLTFSKVNGARQGIVGHPALAAPAPQVRVCRYAVA